jgi:X-Pro dipeptidyl-peptidase (S15 family)
MQRLGPVGRLSRTVDHAVRWRLGRIGVHSGPASFGAHDGVEEFWAASRVLDPAPVTALPAMHRRGRGTGHLLDITAPSSGPCVLPDGGRMVGRVAIHPRPGAPAVLLLHGYAAPSPVYEEHQMRLLLRRGMSAVRIELPFHMHRRTPHRGAGHGFFGSEPAHTCAVLRQATEDAAAVVAWLRRELTPAVGALGFSLGGLVGCLLAAHVGLDSLVAVTPPCDLADLTLERSPTRLRRELGVRPGGGGPWGTDAVAARAVLERAMAPVTPRLLTARTPGDRVTLVSADHDLIVGDEPVRALAGAWGAECWSYGHGHVTVMTARGITARIHQRLGRDLAIAPAASGAVAG